jgi:tetratricopeptide (TPR) repeat protein
MSKRKKSARRRDSQSPSGIFIVSPRLRLLAGVAAIAVAAFIAYLPALNGGFIWDDELLITKNRLIDTSDGLYRIWLTIEAHDYWPVTNTSFWLEWRLWGMNRTGYHLTNLFLHIGASLLIWAILRKLSIPGAFLAALIFAVHPVNVESVAWIAQRKNTLAIFFFLLSILCYLKIEIPPSTTAEHFPQKTPPLSPGPRPPALSTWYWLSLLAFLLAMLSKGSVAILPVLLLGIVCWRRKLTRRDLVRTAPFFVVGAALAAVNVWFQTHGTGEVIRTAGITERLLGAGAIVWFYLYKAILPLNLAFVYPQWNIRVGNFLWWLPLLAAVSLTALLWRYRKGWSRPFLFAWGFFCVSLIPVLGLTDVYFMKFTLVADHYQYIAIIAVIALAAAGWRRWHERVRAQYRLVTVAAAGIATAALVFLTWQQSGLYCDAVTLYRDTLEKNHECWMAHNNLGNILFDEGRLSDAMYHFQEAKRLRPQDAEPYNNVGEVLSKLGRLPEAIEQFQHALEIKPDYDSAHYNLALAYAKTNQPKQAIAMAQEALKNARAKGQTELARKIEDWLNAYRNNLSGSPNATPSGNPAPAPP